MNGMPSNKHQRELPTARKIRRACSNELYRTAKRLKGYISKEQMEQAEKLYTRKVYLNLVFVHENRDNRKKLCDWWDDNVAAEIAELWQAEPEKLKTAFRDAFGG
ncbi:MULTISPECIES: dehydrogenase [unclassified Paenibacillus]|uniref:dehydrogenase n=1 Tax=unclassified Paenibacillus TaxID=185978 RepID=UPI000953C1AD|nr:MULTISPECIES: dehydrogenase [unclassified Paenibacillus]ASS66754.1 dehydrogenase [Paenibacillus sp. RUD330]SIP96403.1 toxin CptA [Paenibacillus sp. RU4X]SIQ14957.1 toxin CptA [Paenibacillus sp. RU4T]